MSKERIAKLESLLARVRKNSASPRRQASAAPQVQAVEPVEDEAIEELDLEDDIVELPADEVVEPAAGQSDFDVDLDLEEPAPESAPRATEAIARPEPEPPLQTPPPESGSQEVGPEISVGTEAELSGAEDVDALLETDLSDRPISMTPDHGGPTMEQLGDTVEIEGAEGPPAQLELGHVAAAEGRREQEHELEASLPAREFAGGYSAGLAPPPDARADLERHDEANPSAPPSSLAEQPPPMSVGGPMVPPEPARPAAPEITERPAVPAGTSPATFHLKQLQAEPETFVGLLDRSLGLKA